MIAIAALLLLAANGVHATNTADFCRRATSKSECKSLQCAWRAKRCAPATGDEDEAPRYDLLDSVRLNYDAAGCKYGQEQIRKTFGSCVQRCDSLPDCVGFNWNTRIKRCFLSRQCGVTELTNLDVELWVRAPSPSEAPVAPTPSPTLRCPPKARREACAAHDGSKRKCRRDRSNQCSWCGGGGGECVTLADGQKATAPAVCAATAALGDAFSHCDAPTSGPSSAPTPPPSPTPAPTSTAPTPAPPPPPMELEVVCASRGGSKKQCQSKTWRDGPVCLWNDVLRECTYRKWGSPCAAGRPLDGTAACDVGSTFAERVADLVPRIPLEDKIAMLSTENFGSPSLSIGYIDWWSEALHGLGGSMHSYLDCGKARHGNLIRGVKFADGTPYAISFPQVIHQGQSFNPRLFRTIAAAIGREGRAFMNQGNSGHQYFAPNINIARDPRWGRAQETPGEDPYMNAAYAESFVVGLQEGDLDETIKDSDKAFARAGACCKHFLAYSVERWWGPKLDAEAGDTSWGRTTRHDFDAQVSERDMAESYLVPFEGCIARGKPMCVMCSYSSVNGEPACGSKTLLTDTARGDLGFEGFMVTDCGDLGTDWETQGFSTSTSDTCRLALEAGTDMDCSSHGKNGGTGEPSSFFHARLGDAVDEGVVSEALVDRALSRVLLSSFRLGMFEPVLPYQRHTYEGDVGTEAHRALALRAAEEGLVLLKNENNFLPLPADSAGWRARFGTSAKVLLTGPLADRDHAQLGNYQGCTDGSSTIRSGLSAAQRDPAAEGGAARFSLTQKRGMNNPAEMNNRLAKAAVKSVRSHDLVVLAVGHNHLVEGEGKDRWSEITLPVRQELFVDRIVAEATAQGVPVVMVVIAGTSIDLSVYKESSTVRAILWAGVPGQRGGEAVANALLGAHNPGGRLSQTIYPDHFRHSCHFLVMDFRPTPVERNVGCPTGRGYRFYNEEPVYTFGHGLSYTEFDYALVSGSRVEVDAAWLSARLGDQAARHEVALTVVVTVTNVGGTHGGAQAVLVFTRSPAAVQGGGAEFEGAVPPLRTLAAFDRTEILAAGGGAQTVELAVRVQHLALVGEDGSWTVSPGSWEVEIGALVVKVVVG